MARRTLRMETVVYIPMEPDEDMDAAIDRFLEQAENAGLKVVGWTRATIENVGENNE